MMLSHEYRSIEDQNKQKGLYSFRDRRNNSLKSLWIQLS